MRTCDDATYERVVTRSPRPSVDRRPELIVVTSTKIVCQIGCSARTPKQANIRLVDSLDEAVAAGFRPCKRCRPDRFGPPPDEAAARDIAAKFAACAADPQLAATGVGGIARRLHISERQLRRIVREHFNATPSQVLRMQGRKDVA